MKSNIINKISVLLFLALVICSVGFVILRSNVVLNRYTDSWWHIAVADEYAKTGVFAKDPFIKDAPVRFAQFGLMDVDNAFLCRLTGKTSMQIFSWCVAGNVGLFLCGAFLAGFWINKIAWQGLVSAVTWMLLYPGQTIIDLGFPFATAVALLGFFTVVMIVRRDARLCVSTYARTIVTGGLLGIIFDMHVFVGAVGCAIAVVAIGTEHIPPARGIILRMSLFWGAFLLVAWRWIVLQVGLRSSLAVENAHMRDALPLDKGMLFIVGAVILMMILSWVVATKEKRKDLYKYFIWVVGYAVALLLLALPPLNNVIMQHTSWYMAHRILWLFPVGIAFALIFSLLIDGHWRGKILVGKLVALIIIAIVLLPAVKSWGMKQLFLARTDEYDIHDFDYLRKLSECNLAGKTVLSDPVTSYYLRGMTGAYVCTVIPGEASPALDYTVLDKNVRDTLLSGAGENVDAILIDIKNGATKQFIGKDIEMLMDIWTRNNNKILVKNSNMIMLQGNKNNENKF